MRGLPDVEQAPISSSTFGCGSLLISFKIFNSLNKSDLSNAVAPSDQVTVNKSINWKTLL